MILRPAGLAVLLTLGACSHGPKAPLPTAGRPATAAGEVDAIAQLLDAGERGDAGKRVRAALKRDPGNPRLQLLRDSIDGDPQALLGPRNFAYTTRAGDTMTGLAERFLGNRLKAYQLSRYNGIDTPRGLAAGQTLRIPGEPPRVEPPRRPTPTPSRPAAARPKPVAPGTVAPGPVAPRPPGAATDRAAAQRLRGAGLAALNAGVPARAVAALRRAAVLDPANPLIARDLARAERIAATVRARQ